MYEFPICLPWANPASSEDDGTVSHFKHGRFLTHRIIYNMKPILIYVVQRLPDYWVSIIPFGIEGELEWVRYHIQLFLQLCRNWTGIAPTHWGRERLGVLVCWGTWVSAGPWYSPHMGLAHPPGQTPVVQPCCGHIFHNGRSIWHGPFLQRAAVNLHFCNEKNGLSGNFCLLLMRLNIKKWFQSNDCVLSGQKHI